MTDRLFGSVRFELWGDFPEDFLTLAAAEGVELWDIKRNGDVFSAKTRPWQTGDVRVIAEKCRLVYTEISQSGLSHTVKKYRCRYGILVGALLLFAFVFISSRFLWKIEITGCENTDIKKFEEKLAEYGVKVGGPSHRGDINDLQLLLLRDFPDIAFVAVNIKGSFAKVEVTERRLPPETVDQYSPCNIVASSPGIIISAKVYSGVTLCKENDVVAKGDLLVSGIFDSKYVGFRMVHAKAEIIARTEKAITAYRPYEYEKEERTGEKKTVYTFNIFGLSFSVGSCPFENYEEENDIKHLKIGENGYLPFSVEKTVYYKTEKSKATRTPEEAEKEAVAEAEEKFRVFNETNFAEEVNTEIIRDSKGVTVKYYCTVISDIAAEKEIFRN